MPPILRTKCNVAYTTPSGSTLSLPVNCAVSDSDGWPWKYFWTKTLGTGSPQLSNGFSRGLPFIVEGNHESGQTVIRAIFAYIATDPISVTISALASGGYNFEDNQSNFQVTARLYTPAGGIVTTYFNEGSEQETGYTDASATIDLPATVCPKIIWIGASVQPTGYFYDDYGQILPPTNASIQFSAS